MVKESKSARIRALLGEGVSPKDIASRLRVAASYVHTVKWQWQNKKVKGKKVAAPVVSTPPPVSTFKDRIDAIIAERVNSYLDKVLS